LLLNGQLNKFKELNMIAFVHWIEKFLEEKGIDLNEYFQVEGSDGTVHYMSFGIVIEAMISAPVHERTAIKARLVKLDFIGADVRKYLLHLSQALVN